jgi:hypothetical protein
MTNSTALAQIDPVLAASRGFLIAGKLKVCHGRYELTRDQITFYRYPRWLAALGVIGYLFMRSMKGTRDLELPLARIATIVRGAYGLNKKVMNIQMVDGTVHRVSVERFDEFSARLHDAMGGRGLALAA